MDSSVVVTGGARGIGRAIAELLVARGHQVVITDIDGAAAADTAAEIGAEEGLTHDVRNPADHEAAAQAALHHAPLTAWFNNAGVGDDGRLTEQSEEQVRRLVEVNLLGTMWGMRAALGAFGKGGGDIVNVASLAGLGPVPGFGVYAASKAGVVSLTASVDAETPRNVRVHAVCPDVVDTAMLTEGHTHDSLGSRIAHSGVVLTADEVARDAVSLLGSRRVLLSVPRWRGGVVRTAAVAPSLSRHAMRLVAAQGRRTIARRAR
ncbi:SDR family NAD(P)-dependent oxidoreductase [Nocardioides coralli]|uniref:SDR family NAD(P)-dependent oxidoreductase n=1 Tax=Nocardioides coralli TaxID=2872154 RepID=UPI001CA436FD|nr:SDR family oxidoreductase [Nocardioides coralli]QZY29672.1 SDR family oxidoreductase [Nocardioides coralli]